MTSRTRQFLGLSVVGVILLGPALYEWVRLSVKERRLDQQLAHLAVRHDELAREQEQLQSNPSYVEGLIRSTFKVAQPGEYVIPLDLNPQADQR